jgi:hypothetical protein
MSENATGNPGDPTAEKDPETWVTGGEPATGAQLSYLRTLAQETGQEVPEDLTKAKASETIDELKSHSERVSGS